MVTKKTQELLHPRASIRRMMKRAVKSGGTRKDFDLGDIIRVLAGVASVASSPDWQQSVRTLQYFRVAGVEGLEPPTLGLEIRCSIRLSYTPKMTYRIAVLILSVLASVPSLKSGA